MKKKSKRTRKPVTVKPPSVDKILDALPLIATIPTAWAIGVALYERLGWPVLVVGIAALGIDAAGFVAADTASKYYEFNRTLEKGERKAPAWIAYGGLGLYIFGTLIMTFLYEPMAAVFPILSAVAFVEFVLRKDQQARVIERQASRQAEQVEREKLKAERKAKRQLRKEEAQAAQVAPVILPQAVQVARKKITDEELLAYLAIKPGEGQKQVAAHFGVTRSAIGQRIKKLYQVSN